MQVCKLVPPSPMLMLISRLPPESSQKFYYSFNLFIWAPFFVPSPFFSSQHSNTAKLSLFYFFKIRKITISEHKAARCQTWKLSIVSLFPTSRTITRISNSWPSILWQPLHQSRQWRRTHKPLFELLIQRKEGTDLKKQTNKLLQKKKIITYI